MQSPPPVNAIGPYRIDGVLGTGGMGTVYAATDTRLNRPVALKVMSAELTQDPDFVRRFHREAEILARLDSPHVIAIYDHGDHDGTPYIATQLISGGDVGGLLRANGPMPPQLAVTIASQLAEALQAAHKAGVTHRDVKPANVLLHDPAATRPHAYLCDFGIARTEAKAITATGVVAGTWAYLAPERVQGNPGSVASDIYALGCLLWTMLSGQPPYGGTDLEIAASHLRAPVPQAQGSDPFSRRLNAVLTRALAKDPAARHPDARALAADLDALRQLPSEEFRPPTAASHAMLRPTAVRRPPKRRRLSGLIAAAASIALIAVLAGGGWWLLKDRNDRAEAEGGRPSSSATTDTGLAPADLDANGRSDLAVFVNGGKAASIPSTEDGFETPAAPVGKADSYYAIGNVDGEGSALYAFRVSGNALIVTKRQDGKDVELDRLVPEKGFEITQFLLGDFDGDGLDDLLMPTARKNVTTYWVATSTGSGFAKLRPWSKPDSVPLGNDYSFVGDWDGDGDHDIATVIGGDTNESRSTWIHVLRSSGSTFVLDPEVLKVPEAPSGLETALPGDFDGNGRDELAIMLPGSAPVVKVASFEERPPLSSSWLTIPASSWYDDPLIDRAQEDMAAGDFDDDGKDDLAWLPEPGDGQQKVTVFFSTGTEFAQGEPWGSFTCDDWCAEAKTVVVGGS